MSFEHLLVKCGLSAEKTEDLELQMKDTVTFIKMLPAKQQEVLTPLLVKAYQALISQMQSPEQNSTHAENIDALLKALDSND